MLRRQVVLAVLLLIGIGFWLPPAARGEGPVVRAVLFYSDSCPHCHVVLEQVLPPLQARYGPQLEIRTIEISTADNYELLLRVEALRGIPPEKGVVPELFIGEYVLFGQKEIAERLPPLIEEFLAQGGVGWPEGLETLDTPTAQPTRTPKACHTCDEEVIADQATPSPTQTPQPLIHVAYFSQAGCRDCDRARYDLQYLGDKYPQLQVHEFDVKQHASLAEWLGQRHQVPFNKRLTAPALFAGSDVLLGEAVNVHNLEALIRRYLATGSEAYWSLQTDLGSAEAGILQRFQSFGPLTVMAAGLVDGLNPCAFATIVFFISYLSFVGRKGGEILLVGAMFALGVFLAYFGVGVGLLKLLSAQPFLPVLSRYLYGLTALLCLTLAIGSLDDWYQMRIGRPEGMKLKLPVRLRRRINQVIRQGVNVRAIAGVALVTGIVISLIELACTGQVYLPTIIFVLGVPALRVRALLYLFLYNVLFVLPLIAVFLLAYWGTTSERLGRFVNERTGAIKLVTAGLFVVLAGWMVVML